MNIDIKRRTGKKKQKTSELVTSISRNPFRINVKPILAVSFLMAQLLNHRRYLAKTKRISSL